MTGLAVLAAAFVIYALVSGRLDRWSITAPMVFIVVGAVLGPSGVDLLHVSPSSETVRAIAELTLAILLFADASTVRLREVEQDVSTPSRMLFIGLPLTIVAGTLAARALTSGVGWAGAALVAAILAPTDAALGLGIFTDRTVPVRIRRSLNVESGLNDGIAAPFVTLFLALVVAEQGVGPTDWLIQATMDVALAVLVGILVGVAGGKSMVWAEHRGWMSTDSQRLAVLALAFLSYSLSIAIGGNGFVAAFVGGIVFGAGTGGSFREATSFTERLGLFSSFLVWSIFGALFAAPVLVRGVEPAVVVYALLSLTVVRMIPVALSLIGTGFRGLTVAFMGWFGPRGLASVVFALIAFETLQGHGAGADRLVEVTTLTILLSVFAHGLSAAPLAAAYGRRVAAGGRDVPELAQHREPKIRRSL